MSPSVFSPSACRARGLSNLQVITADVVAFAPQPKSKLFDRVVSVEVRRHWGDCWVEVDVVLS